MKKLCKVLFIIFIVLLNVKCADEFSAREYPRIKTLPVTEVSSNSATFHADIIYRGDFEVIEYGFVWDDTGGLKSSYSNKVTFSDNIQNDKFSSSVSMVFQSSKKYYVRAFIQTSEHIVYGQQVAFESP